MNKSISLFILSAGLTVACFLPSKQSYYDESTEIQENTELSAEVQEPVKREPKPPNDRSETEEDKKFYYEEENKLDEYWDEFIDLWKQLNEVSEKAMTD